MLNNTSDILREFGKRVVSRARANLTRKDRNVSKKLYDSLNFESQVMPNSIFIRFVMEEYGMFMDKGVKGANPSLADTYNWVYSKEQKKMIKGSIKKKGVQKAPMSKYAFRNKMPPLKPIMDWVKARKVRLRDEKGKFKKGNYKTLAFIIQKRIFAQGIKPSLFFTKPFLSAYKDLPTELVEAYGLDIKDFFNK